MPVARPLFPVLLLLKPRVLAGRNAKGASPVGDTPLFRVADQPYDRLAVSTHPLCTLQQSLGLYRESFTVQPSCRQCRSRSYCVSGSPFDSRRWLSRRGRGTVRSRAYTLKVPLFATAARRLGADARARGERGRRRPTTPDYPASPGGVGHPERHWRQPPPGWVNTRACEVRLGVWRGTDHRRSRAPTGGDCAHSAGNFNPERAELC